MQPSRIPLQLEQACINNEIWAPVQAKIKASAKAFLLVGGNYDITATFSDYRKYSVTSTVIVASETSQ